MSTTATQRHHRPGPAHHNSPPQDVRRSAPVPTPPPVPVDRIRHRAFEIFLSRQGRPGDPLSDWLQAEREVCRQANVARHPETRGEILMHDVE